MTFYAKSLVADPPLWVANLHGSYQLTKEWQIYGVIDGRDRDTERADRPPHGDAGPAASGVRGDARKAGKAKVASGIGTLPPRANAAACPQLAKAGKCSRDPGRLA